MFLYSTADFAVKRNFETPESGFKIISNMVKHEGPTSFFKGLTPKLLITGPKLVFSFWLGMFSPYPEHIDFLSPESHGQN